MKHTKANKQKQQLGIVVIQTKSEKPNVKPGKPGILPDFVLRVPCCLLACQFTYHDHRL